MYTVLSKWSAAPSAFTSLVCAQPPPELERDREGEREGKRCGVQETLSLVAGALAEVAWELQGIQLSRFPCFLTMA